MVNLSKRIQLRSRDRQVLDHVLRYSMTTDEALRRHVLPGSSQATVRSLLRRLAPGKLSEKLSSDERQAVQGHYYLQKFPLVGKKSYFTFTRLGAHTAAATRGLNAHDGMYSSLDAQALVSRYALLAYCCYAEREEPLELIRPEEFSDDFPSYCGAPEDPQTAPQKLSPRNYYLAPSALGPCLTLLVGGYNGTDRTISDKVRKRLDERRQRPEFRALMRNGRFAVKVLVEAEVKAKRLNKLFGNDELSRGVSASVVPGLEELIDSQGKTR